MTLFIGKDSLIKLNVGGVRFYTNYETIMPSCYLRRLVSRRIADGSDEIFIDRSGTLFQNILYYLQQHRIIPNLQRSQLLEPQVESEFYELEDLADAVYDTLSNIRESSPSFNKEYSLIDLNDLQNVSCVSENTPNGDIRLKEIIADHYEVITMVKYNDLTKGGIQSKLLLAKKN